MKFKQHKDVTLFHNDLLLQYDILVATHSKLLFRANLMIGLLVMYNIDWLQYHAAIDEDKKCYHTIWFYTQTFFITKILKINASLPKLRQYWKKKLVLVIITWFLMDLLMLLLWSWNKIKNTNSFPKMIGQVEPMTYLETRSH